MSKENYKLREKAVAAYEASDLKPKDVEENRGAASRIKQFLSSFGIAAEVDSNIFEIEGIRLYSFPLKNILETYGYGITASRKCDQCGGRIVMELGLEDVSPAEFGQWLSKPHLCEFTLDKEEKRKVGF